MKIPPKSKNIRITGKKNAWYVRFDALETFGGPDSFRKFAKKADAVKFSKGMDVIATPKKGRELKITESANYDGQFEDWFEAKTGEEILSAPITVFHQGNRKSFLPKETCFFLEVPSVSWRAFGDFSDMVIAEIPAGTLVEYYDDDEVRVDLSAAGIRIWAAK